MMDIKQVTETIAMIEEQNFDVRTITMGISLLDCIDSDIDKAAEKVYNKIVSKAKNLVAVGDEIAAELGIPIVNKRVSVTPISIIGAATDATDYVPFAKALDRAAKEIGVNFIGKSIDCNNALVYTPCLFNSKALCPGEVEKAIIVPSGANIGANPRFAYPLPSELLRQASIIIIFVLRLFSVCFPSRGSIT